MYSIGWTIFSVVAIFASMAVVSRKNPIYGALWLMLFFFSISGVYIFLNASFLAAVQLFIYVGAVVVLYLFVIMMLDFDKLKEERRAPLVSPLRGIIFCSGLFVLLVVPLRAGSQHFPINKVGTGFGSTPWMAENLYLKYPFPIELTSILLIVALVGAFALTGRYMKQDENRDKPEVEEEKPVKTA